MIVRSIEQQEKERFIQLYDDPGEQNWINLLFTEKETRPEWCFVVEENGKHLGRVVYFQFEGEDSEMCLFGLTLPWKRNYVGVGEKLINESVQHIKTQALKKLEFRCDTDETYHQEMRAVFEKAGFQLTQDKCRYILTDFDAAHESGKQLEFKTLDEVGEAGFIDAIKLVTVDTLDRADQDDLEHFGSEEAAKEYFTILKSIDDDPQHWILAYDANQELVGLVVAQKLSQTTGCINYVGVVPAQRGKNYSRDLLIKASDVLKDDKSIERIVADIDKANFPLEKTLSSLQYQASKTMWIYHKYFQVGA